MKQVLRIISIFDNEHRSSIKLMLFLTASISFVQDFLSGNDILFKHLGEKDVVDFNVMCRNSIVEETWWEHHLISVIPELNTILRVEVHLISSVDESASSENTEGGPEVAEKSWVVQWTVA